ncbi:hypothetical protein QTP88_001441 [Uroleucon formosanum]
MADLDIDIKLPRIIKRQTQRANTPATCPEEYYRRVLFIPILENVIEDLKARFLNDKNKTIFIIMQLVSINAIKMSPDLANTLIKTLVKHFSFIDFNIYSLKGEIELWKTKWEQTICKALTYAYYCFAVLFIRLKNWLRSRMTEQRLTGLALLNIHRTESCSKIVGFFRLSQYPSVLDTNKCIIPKDFSIEMTK